MKINISLLLISLLSLASCKKEAITQNPQNNCLIDSISVNNYDYFFPINNVNSGYKFNYEGHTIKEIKVYNPFRFVEIQKLFFDNKNRLHRKEYYAADSTSPYRKNVFLFDNRGNFSGMIAYLRYPGSATVYFRTYKMEIGYNGETPYSISYSQWSYNDTINPFTSPNTILTGKNGNVEKIVWDSPVKDSFLYRINTSENLLRKDFQFLIDPVFDENNFYFPEALNLLPILLNKNTTTEIMDGINIPHFFIRSSFNQYGQPESVSSSFATWDYYYKNCQ